MMKLLAVLTLCSSLSAFEVFGVRWENTPVAYQVDGPWKLRKAVERAAGKWSAAASGQIEFCAEGAPDLQITWVRRGWKHDPIYSAVTTFWTLDGVIIGATLEVNAENHKWRRYSRKLACKKQYENLDAVILHELGHVLGINHSPLRDAAMYFASDVTVLSGDDILAIQFLYN